MKKVVASLHANLNIECPSCDKDFDLFLSDDYDIFTIPIFNNRWDDLKNEEVICPECEHEFKILSIEW